MSITFWLRIEPLIRPTRLTINILFITARMKGRFICVWNCLIFSWVNTHPFDLQFVVFCSKFSRDSYVEFQEKTISGEFFRNLAQTKAIIYQNLWNFALLSAILFWVRITLKKFKRVPSYVVCTQVRRHVHKISQKEDTGKKSQDVLFSENQVISLSVWDLLRLTAWVFWSENFTRRSSLFLLSFG